MVRVCFPAASCQECSDGHRPPLHSKELFDDEFEEVDATVGVAPFVVVPADELEEFAVELDAGPGVEDAGVGVVDEVGGGDFVLGVGQDALEVGFARLFHGRLDFGVAGFLGRLDGEVDHGDRGGGDAEGHAGELAFEIEVADGDFGHKTSEFLTELTEFLPN